MYMDNNCLQQDFRRLQGWLIDTQNVLLISFQDVCKCSWVLLE